jgi:hypothetical protein
MEIQVVDKNCWIEVFDDTKYDADDPHIKVEGPKEYASLKNLNGRDWIRILSVRRSLSLRASAFLTFPSWTCPTTLNR